MSLSLDLKASHVIWNVLISFFYPTFVWNFVAKMNSWFLNTSCVLCYWGQCWRFYHQTSHPWGKVNIKFLFELFQRCSVCRKTHEHALYSLCVLRCRTLHDCCGWFHFSVMEVSWHKHVPALFTSLFSINIDVFFPLFFNHTHFISRFLFENMAFIQPFVF